MNKRPAWILACILSATYLVSMILWITSPQTHGDTPLPNVSAAPVRATLALLGVYGTMLGTPTAIIAYKRFWRGTTPIWAILGFVFPPAGALPWAWRAGEPRLREHRAASKAEPDERKRRKEAETPQQPGGAVPVGNAWSRQMARSKAHSERAKANLSKAKQLRADALAMKAARKALGLSSWQVARIQVEARKWDEALWVAELAAVIPTSVKNLKILMEASAYGQELLRRMQIPTEAEKARLKALEDKYKEGAGERQAAWDAQRAKEKRNSQQSYARIAAMEAKAVTRDERKEIRKDRIAGAMLGDIMGGFNGALVGWVLGPRLFGKR